MNFYQNNLLKISLLIVTVSACSAIGFAAGTKGGSGTGGGNTQPYTILDTPDTVLVAVHRAQKALLPNFEMLKDVEYLDDYKTPMQMFYAKNPSIESVLKQVRYDIRMDQPCYETNTGKMEIREGSADPATNTVCISPFQIAKDKYPETQATERKIIGLLAHEVSHLRGTNEPQAVLVQQNFEDSSATLETLNGWVSLIHNTTTGAISDIKRMEQASNSDLGSLCDAAGYLEDDIQDLKNDGTDNRNDETLGYYDIDRVSNALVDALNTQFITLKAATCDQKLAIDRDNLAFGSYSVLNMESFYQRGVWAYALSTSPDIKAKDREFYMDKLAGQPAPGPLGSAMNDPEHHALARKLLIYNIAPYGSKDFSATVIENLNEMKKELLMLQSRMNIAAKTLQ